MLIEKQALLDVLLDTRVWSEKYVINPFPYIEEDITKIQEEDHDDFFEVVFENELMDLMSKDVELNELQKSAACTFAEQLFNSGGYMIYTHHSCTQ